MGVSQLQSQVRLQASKVLSSSIWKWKWKPPPHRDSSQTPVVSLSPIQSRCFGSNSMDDPFSFPDSDSRSSSRQRRSPPNHRDGHRPSNFSDRVSTPSPRDNQNQRFRKPSQSSSFRFPNEGSISQQKSESPSQTDFSFLEKFKLNTDNQSSNGEKKEQSSPSRVSESLQENQSHPQLQRPPEAEEIFKKMKETGLIPNAVAMLDGLCKDGLVQEAMKLFGLMREKGTIPEVVIYTAVVDGFCKAEQLDEAIRIFRKMQTNGISPNAFSFAVLIHGLYKCKMLEEAVGFCLEMLESGHSPNITTFVGLIDELCRERGVDEAQKVIETLKQKGFLINEKALRDFLNKKAPFSPIVWEAILGKKPKEFF